MASTLSFDILARDRASKTMDDVGAHASKLHSTFSMLGTGLKVAGAGIAAGLGFAAVTGIKTAASMEQASVAFTTLLGSGTKAQSFLSQLQKFAAATPFDFPGLVDASRQLLGAGAAAKDVIPTLTAYGDAAGALGISQDRFNNIMLATTQAMSSGKLQAGDLLQMTEAGLPVWKLLSEATGKPVASLRKLSSEGKLLTSTTLPLLQKQMEKDYGGSMAKQSQTLSGIWSTLMDTFNMGLANIIKPLIPELKKLATDGIKFLGTAFTDLSKAGTYLSGTVWPKVKSAFYSLLEGWKEGQGVGHGLNGTLDKIAAGAKNLWQIAGPLLAQAWDKLKTAWSVSVPIIKTVASDIGDVVHWLGQHKTLVQSVAVAILAGVVAYKAITTAMTLWKVATNAVKAAQAALNLVMDANPIGLVVIAVAALAAGLFYAYNHSKTFRNGVHDAMHIAATAAKFMWSVVKPQFEAFKTAIKIVVALVRIQVGLWVGAFRLVGSVAKTVFSAVRTAVSWVGSAFAAAWHSVSTYVGNIVGAVRALPGRIRAVGGAMLSAGQHVISMFWSGLKSIASGIGGVASSIWGGVKGFINSNFIYPLRNFGVSILGHGIHPFGGIPALAAGGRPNVRGLNLVGERGPELFVPDTAGTILNASRTSALLGSEMSTGGGRGDTYIVHVTVQGSVRTERDLVDSIIDGIDTRRRRHGQQTSVKTVG